MNKIQEQFNSISAQYDQQRPFLIPCFNDFYKISLPLVKGFASAKTVLDIGAGTGLFSQFVYEQRPDLHFTLIDISDEMLTVAKKRFHGLSNFDFEERDFSKGLGGKKYDLVISSLAIHHLDDQEKALLYKGVYNGLNDGGIFINADQVEGRSQWTDGYFKTQWREMVDRSGLEQPAIDRALERMKLDKFATLDAQLQTLEAVGFQEVDCIYQFLNFVVFTGRKTVNY